MKKFLISAIVIVALILLGVLIFGDADNSYVADIENDVTDIEAELADVEGLIASDELTEANATAAYEHITEHLGSIEASVEASQTVTLSDEEKGQLVDAFGQLAETISNYSDVLNVLEGTASVNASSALIIQLQEVVAELESYINEVDADETSEADTDSDVEESDEAGGVPLMEDGTLTEEEASDSASTNSEETTTTDDTEN